MLHLYHYGLVHTPVPIPQAVNIPVAKAAVDEVERVDTSARLGGIESSRRRSWAHNLCEEWSQPDGQSASLLAEWRREVT